MGWLLLARILGSAFIWGFVALAAGGALYFRSITYWPLCAGYALLSLLFAAVGAYFMHKMWGG